MKSSHSLSSSESHKRKEAIIDTVLKDEDVLSYWFAFAFDITSEEDALELLKHIVTLWLSIRGFSLAKSWMEEYKRATQTTTKKKSLRKELKKAEQPKPSD